MKKILKNFMKCVKNFKQQKDSSYMIKMIKTIKDKPLLVFYLLITSYRNMDSQWM